MSDDNVKVLVRCRPFNQREGAEGAFNIIKIDKRMGQVVVQQPETRDITGKQCEKRQSHTFTFDAAYGYDESSRQWSTQTEVFDETCRPAVEFVLQGFNSTIFAYGQTGSGKTYTMMGYGADAGVIPQAIQRVFDFIQTAGDDRTYLIKTSFFEIYNEQIRDLMTGKQNLPLHEHPQKGVYVENLSEYLVSSDREISALMERGNKHRSVAATAMNATSSRSHSIFQIIVESCENQDQVKIGRLNLVDLAGSERQSKTEATGDRLKEGAKINLSLSTLGIVISKLVDGDPHIPYRQSKLTHLLKDSLGGNSKTLMVVAISPASTNYDETMSTLRYADRAKRIKNKPKINEDPKDAQIRAMREQIETLEKQLAAVLAGAPRDAAGQAEQAAAILNIQAQLAKIRVVRKQRPKKSPEELARMQEEQQALLETLQRKEQKSEKARALVEKFASQIEEQRRRLAEQRKEELEAQQSEQERELRLARQKLAEQKVAEQELTRRLAEQRETQNQEITQYNNIQDEIAALKAKIDKYTQKKAEMEDQFAQTQAENANQRQAKTDDLERIQVQIAMRQSILDWFMPQSLQTQLGERCAYDETADEWRLQNARASGNARRGLVAVENQ